MPIFNWLAKTKEQKLIKGETEALSIDDLKKILEQQDLILVESIQFVPSSFFKISIEQKAQFFYNLKSLLESGLLLPQSLELLLPNIKNSSLKKIISDVLFMLHNGFSFSHALTWYKETFDTFTIQIIKSGEESGKLNESFKSLNEYWELKSNFVRKIKSALFGPLIILIFFFIIFIILLLYIIPAFKQLVDFKTLELNLLSKTIFSLSDVIVLRPYFFILGFIWLFIALIILLKTKGVREFVYKVPIFYSVKRYIFLTSFLRSIALLLYSGLSITKAFDLLSQSVTEIDLKSINADLESGVSLSKALEKYKIFPTELIAMISVAEDSGKMAQALEFASKIYFGYLNKRLAAFTYILQPMLIILLGLLIGIVIASIYLPIVQMPMGGMQI